MTDPRPALQKSVRPLLPGGGLRAGATRLLSWNWRNNGVAESARLRCKPEQWYLFRARGHQAGPQARAAMLLSFFDDRTAVQNRWIELAPVTFGGSPQWLGWVQSPPRAIGLSVRLMEDGGAQLLEEIDLHAVAERDPKCHPLANVPRWGIYRPPFPIDRVVLPASLGALTTHLGRVEVEVLETPRSASQLAEKVIGSAWILDPAWVAVLRLTPHDIDLFSEASLMIVDLETAARMAPPVGPSRARVTTHASPNEIMSARVQYADYPTRGFALQDVLPYGFADAQGHFCMRVLDRNRAWKRYSTDVGFAPLLTSETPWEDVHGDVVSAARAASSGELIATDLPWLVAGCMGAPLAPHAAAHLLRMHLGLEAPPDGVQFWNRWDDSQIVLRDIVDLARRYPPLRALRWAPHDAGVAQLGVALTPPEGAAQTLMICTGRIDNVSMHAGIAPEPMMIFMKSLARELTERSDWSRRHLDGRTIVWQFDAAAGLRYATLYESAGLHGPSQADLTLRLRYAAEEPPGPLSAGSAQELPIAHEIGVMGDGSVVFQENLQRRLCAWIEGAAR